MSEMFWSDSEGAALKVESKGQAGKLVFVVDNGEDAKAEIEILFRDVPYLFAEWMEMSGYEDTLAREELAGLAVSLDTQEAYDKEVDEWRMDQLKSANSSGPDWKVLSAASQESWRKKYYAAETYFQKREEDKKWADVEWLDIGSGDRIRVKLDKNSCWEEMTIRELTPNREHWTTSHPFIHHISRMSMYGTLQRKK